MTTKERFDEALNRCDTLCNLYKTVANDDLLRAAIVLGVAAMDGYVVDRFMDEFIIYLKTKKLTENEVAFLEKAKFKLENALEIMREKKERPFRHVRTIVEHAYERNSMQDFEKIDDFYSFYGLPNITENAAKKAAKIGRIGKAWSKPGWQRILDALKKMINRRHEIAHAADYNGKNKPSKISIDETKQWLKYMRYFVDSIEEILKNKFHGR